MAQPPDISRMDGNLCLVTGATRGIGKAIAVTLGEHGATVVGTATTDDGAARIDAYLKAAGIEGAGMVLDVTDDDAVAALMKSVGDDFGAPSVLVNNAGITRDNLLLRMKHEEWDAVLDANLKSAYRLCKAALRGMTRARRGRIVNIASVVAASGNPGQAN
ncbi:MAG: SDR family NAD(P)-dependent oxidoreductase, partial [bacterium]